MKMVIEREVVEEQVAAEEMGTVVVVFASGDVKMIESIPFHEFQECEQESHSLKIGDQEITFDDEAVRVKWFDEEAMEYGY